MALDELRDNDDSFDIDGFQYVVEKTFLEQAKPIKVDFQFNNLQVTSSIDLGPGCGGSCSGETNGSCG